MAQGRVPSSINNRKITTSLISGKDGTNRNTDVEKGEGRTTNSSSHYNSHNSELQRASSRGSVLSTPGKVRAVNKANNRHHHLFKKFSIIMMICR